MAKKKKGKKKRKTNWGELADELESQGQGTGYFLKKGKNRLRIIPEDPDDDKSWFTDVNTIWQGKPRPRKLIRAIPLDQDEDKLLPVVLPKTAMKGIFNILDEGYDLLSEDEGYGITINKSGEQLNTSYAVMPSRRVVAVPDGYEDMEMTLEEAAEEIEKESKERDASAAEEKKGKKKKGKRKKKARDEEDEDDEDEEEGW